MRAKLANKYETTKFTPILFHHNPIFGLIILHFANCKLGKKTPLLLELSNGSSCTLFVPKGSIEAYRQAPYWQDFAEIREIE